MSLLLNIMPMTLQWKLSYYMMWFGKHWKTPVVGFDCQGVPPNPLAFNKCPLKGVPP